MLVEYLFEIPPLTFLLISISLILFVLFTRSKPKSKTKPKLPSLPYEYIPVASPSPDKKSISLISYNIMSYNFTKLEWFPYVKSEYLYPKYRSPRIINEIENANADILCLQECDNDLFAEYYKNILQVELGYTCIANPSSNPNKKNVINVICYKTKMFNEIEVNVIDLNEDLSKIDESFAKHKEALIVQLQLKETKEKFIVITTHLYWNPEYEYVRYGEIAKILSTAYEKYKNVPLFLCGDFNACPKSNVLRYIYKEKPDYSENVKGDQYKNGKYIDIINGDEKYSNRYQLKSAYDGYKKEKTTYSESHPDFTTYTNEVIGNYDYIIYTEDSLRLVELLKVPTENEGIKKDKLPNKDFPSDHLKIGAKFVFK